MCLDDQVLNTYIDEELEEPWKSQVEEHLSYCQSCKKRFDELLEFNRIIKGAELTDEEIKPHQDRVLAMLENNYLSKRKKVSFFSKKFQVSTRSFMGIAAAFVVVFVGSWAMFGKTAGAPMLIPDANNNISINNITPVRATDNAASSRTLESYSLDDILKSLDARGYDVDIKLKSIQPVSFSGEDSEVVILELENGIKVTKDGTVRNAEGEILAKGVRVEDQTILASDGTVLMF